MLQKELVKAIALSQDVTIEKANSILNTITTIVTNEMIAKWEVKLPWVWVFSTLEVSAREWRNPKTGDLMMINAYTRVGFKTSKVLKDLLK